MGRSGSGKTTFLNIAGLLDTFDGGTYLLDGEDVSRLTDREMSRIRNHKIGFVFQSFNLIPDLDVFDNVDVPLRYRRLPAAERKERIERAVELVGLSSRLHHLPSQLSGGQQQRVAIARVLAGDPKLILADEPTGNLDSLMSREVMDLLETINARGTTIVMVTHAPECAARASREIHLLDGKVVDLDAPRRRRGPRPARLGEPRGRRWPEEARPCSSTTSTSPGRACGGTACSPRLIVIGIALGIALSTTFARRAPRVRAGPDPREERASSTTSASTAGIPQKAYPAEGPNAAADRRSPTATWPRS